MDGIRLLWPRKKLFYGCLVPDDVEDPDQLINSWKKRLGGDLTAVEKMINHVHLLDLLFDLDGLEKTTTEELVWISRAYVAFLKAEIERVAPKAAYEVKAYGDFDKIPVVDLPDGKQIRHVEAMEVEIVCWLHR